MFQRATPWWSIWTVAPSGWHKYRTYWTRAGFRVIDCPSLTQRGKSSTDVNLVLDAMDALSGSANPYGGVPEAAARPGRSDVENQGSDACGP